MSNRTPPEWPLAAVVALCDGVAAGTEEIPCFVACGKAGMKHVTRDDFSKEYAAMRGSPFLRVLKKRGALEQEFLNKLTAAVFACEPPEDLVQLIAASLGAAQNNPVEIPTCMKLIEPYCSVQDAASLQAEFDKLWPSK